MQSTRIAELSARIHTNTAKIDYYFNSNGLPTPSFDVHGPLMVGLPDDIAAYREAVVAAADELYWLMKGPIDTVMLNSVLGSPSMQVINRFNIASSFPVNETSTFAQIANKCGLPESETKRILRHAMTNHIFCEPSKGIVAHTAATKAFAQVPGLSQWCGMIMDELFIAGTRIADALDKWPGSQEPEHCGFNIAYGVDEPFFTELGKHADRAKRFKEAMLFSQSSPALAHAHVLESYDWSKIENGLVVDVGGSHGNVSIEVARKHPSIRFIVQDLPEVIVDGTKLVPPGLSNRISFMEHEFFQEQPVKGADVYYFRWILHDWSDKYAIKILRALIPALKPGAKVLINEMCLPDPGVLSYYEQKMPRGLDMQLLGMQNAKERDIDDWTKLLQDADPRFKLEAVNMPPNSLLAMIVVTWEGDAVPEPPHNGETTTNAPSISQTNGMTEAEKNVANFAHEATKLNGDTALGSSKVQASIVEVPLAPESNVH